MEFKKNYLNVISFAILRNETNSATVNENSFATTMPIRYSATYTGIRVKTCPKCKRGEKKMCQNVTKSRLSLFFLRKIAGPLINLIFFYFTTGMAAVNVVLETLQSGDHVVASNQVIKSRNFTV
jgi:cystathionine beta-lyase/cystathionine gamma-synthase